MSDLRAGLRLSYITVAWTTVACATSIGLGAAAGSLVLVAFGVTGLLDAAGSAVLAAHFRHVLRHEAASEHLERLAHRVISSGLLVTGAATAVESIRRLLADADAHRSVPGAVIAGLSAVVLAVLARAKRVTATRLGSGAMLADSWLSAVGALLAALTVGGAVLAGADPVFALLIALGAGWLGQRELRASRR